MNNQKKGIAIAALVLGIAALLGAIVSAWTIVLGVLSFIVGIVGLVFGIIAIKRKLGGMGVAGLVLSIIAIIVSVLAVGLSVYAVMQVNSNYNSPVPSVTTGDQGTGDAAGDSSSDKIVIKSAKCGSDGTGGNVIDVTYTWTNGSSEANAFGLTYNVVAYQDGVELDVGAGLSDDSALYAEMNNVKPGKTQTLKSSFELNDTTHDVEVKVVDFMDSSTVYVTKTFKVEM